MATHIDDNLEDKIIEMYKANKKYKDIINELNVNATTITRTIRKRGLRLRGDTHSRSEEEIKNLCIEYKKGATIVSLEKKYHTSGSTIAKILHENGISVRKKGRRSKSIDESIIHKAAQDHMKGMKLKDISKKYNIDLVKLRMLMQTTILDGYDYDLYSRKTKPRNDFGDMKINNRYAFYETMSHLGYTYKEIVEKIESIEQKHGVKI